MRVIGSRGAVAVLVAIAGLLVLAGCGSSSAPGESEAPFSTARAWRLIESQVDVGQRPAGSPQLRRLAVRLREMLPHGRFEPIPGQPGLRNVVGSLPGAKPAVVLGAHYDTLVKPRGFVGANNGAAGTAIVVEVARALARTRPQPGERELRFVLFDGEEPAAGLPEDDPNFARDGLRGSRAYVRAHASDTKAMILLDYVGNRGLQLPREGTSTAWLWRRLRAAAEKVGKVGYFPPSDETPIIDDHTPFLQSHIPAIDLIDWRYPGHSLKDGLDQIDPNSLDAVGETVLELIRELRAS